LWVKQEAAELIGLYTADFARSNAEGLSALPLVGTRGLKVDRSEMQDLAARNIGLLREGVSKELAAQAIRNLAFLGRCFAANGAQWHRRQDQSAVTYTGPDSEVDGEENEGEDGMNSFEESEEDSTAIEYIFQKLAKILRRELRKPQDPSDMLHRRAEALYPKSAALQLSAALCNILPSPTLALSADTIILPLVHLTDSQITAPSSADIAFGEAYNELVNNATELMDVLQKKLGTTEYVKALQRVKKQVQKRREERRQKRKIEAVSMPEKIERMKKRKRQADKVRRKEKGAMERGKRRGW
jgi:U3 small nucleolar RNA-associated protein 20